MKFKDGSFAETDLGQDFTIEGSGDFLRGLLVGKEKNSDIIINDTITRKYEDVYSVELIF